MFGIFDLFREMSALKAVEADPVGFVLTKTADELVGLPDIVRNTALKLVAQKAVETGDKKAIESASALLYHSPYPADIEQSDLKAAQKFKEIWAKSVQAHTTAGQAQKRPAADLYRDSCTMAIKALRLPLSRLDISFETCVFVRAEGDQARALKPDFDGVADACVARHGMRYKATLRMNKANDIWNGLYEPSSPEAVDIALYGIHEVTHVEQMLRLMTNSADIFYDNMMRQSLAMNGLKHSYRLYRCGLEERQAYLRMSYAGALIKKEAIHSERIYLDRHLHEHTMKPVVTDAANALLERLAGGAIAAAMPAVRQGR